jgi:hypothetical protein
MEFFFIRNTHPWGLHTSYLIKRLLLWNQHISSIFLQSRLISFSLVCGLVTIVSWYQIYIYLIRSHIGSHGVFGLVSMCYNSNGWFPISRTISGSIFLVTSSNLFCSPLWKVTTSSTSFLGYSSRSMLFMWPTSTFFCKTYSILFFMLLVNTIGILYMITKKVVIY